MRVHGVDLIPEGDRVVVNWQRDGSFEPESVAIWLAAVRDGGVALDVGAYTGLYALLAACSGAQAVAYEPNPMYSGGLSPTSSATAWRSSAGTLRYPTRSSGARSTCARK